MNILLVIVSLGCLFGFAVYLSWRPASGGARVPVRVSRSKAARNARNGRLP